MRRALMCLCIMIFSMQVNANTNNHTESQLSIPDITSADIKLKQFVQETCTDLGEVACNSIKITCKTNAHPNLCFTLTLYRFGMFSEFCKNDSSCVLEQEQYYKKSLPLFDKALQKPGYARMAVNVCSPLYEIEPKSNRLLSIKTVLDTSLSGLTDFYDFKKLHSCLIDTYTKSITK